MSNLKVKVNERSLCYSMIDGGFFFVIGYFVLSFLEWCIYGGAYGGTICDYVLCSTTVAFFIVRLIQRSLVKSVKEDAGEAAANEGVADSDN